MFYQDWKFGRSQEVATDTPNIVQLELSGLLSLGEASDTLSTVLSLCEHLFCNHHLMPKVIE